jgi:membrane associated rhomboid family serine protease
MLPLRDDNPTYRFPILTVVLIAVNVLVFVWQTSKPGPPGVLSPGSQASFICEYGAIPDRLADDRPDTTSPGNRFCERLNARHARAVSLVTSQFLHAGWLHLLGNMLFLWIFANNIEDRLGRVRFLPFYLLCGAIAAFGQTLVDPGSPSPLIGASGAIAGILGAYLLLYPTARLLTFPLVFLRIPAWIFLAFWFAMQFFYTGGQEQEGGGVAYWAHVFGFVAGLVFIKPFLIGRPVPPPRPPAIQPIRP